MSNSYDIHWLSSLLAYGMSAVNCTAYPYLQPNQDIAGIGVRIFWSYGDLVGKLANSEDLGRDQLSHDGIPYLGLLHCEMHTRPPA
jgi:hypothetical protein